jgi:XRE family aerobic/anaerobic benzoate catabolism transcriptional regulator
MTEQRPPEDGTNPLLLRVGRIVRAARTEKGMPRRVLSEASGISPRYLAQLESGQGNISLALMQRVARALGISVVDLVSDPQREEERRLVMLFRHADQPTRDAVIHRLEVAAEVPDRARRICLIGLRGAGKSTLGRRAGEALGVPFVELNKDIEVQGGMPVPEIMALYGAEGYRQLEAEAVRRVAVRHDRLILAVAGGIVSDPKTYATLLARYHTIWVKASPQEHMARVRAQGDSRPMEGQPRAMEQLRALLEARSTDYARADAQLDTTGRTLEQSLTAMLDLIREKGFLV